MAMLKLLWRGDVQHSCFWKKLYNISFFCVAKELPVIGLMLPAPAYEIFLALPVSFYRTKTCAANHPAFSLPATAQAAGNDRHISLAKI